MRGFVVGSAILVALSLLYADSAAADESKSKVAKKTDKPASSATAAVKQRPSPYLAAVPQKNKNRASVKVYTNEDLAKIRTGLATPSTTTQPAPVRTPRPDDDDERELASQSDRPTAVQIREGAQSKRAAARAARNEIAAAKAEVAKYERQLLSIRNPFAARSEVDDEERRARQSDSSVAQRLTRVEDKLAAAKDRLAQAEEALEQQATRPATVDANANADSPRSQRSRRAPRRSQPRPAAADRDEDDD